MLRTHPSLREEQYSFFIPITFLNPENLNFIMSCKHGIRVHVKFCSLNTFPKWAKVGWPEKEALEEINWTLWTLVYDAWGEATLKTQCNAIHWMLKHASCHQI